MIADWDGAAGAALGGEAGAAAIAQADEAVGLGERQGPGNRELGTRD